MHLPGVDQNGVTGIQSIKIVLYNVVVIAGNKKIDLQMIVQMQLVIFCCVGAAVVGKVNRHICPEGRNISIKPNCRVHSASPLKNSILGERIPINAIFFMLS